jgi:hypothetical protein
LEFGQNAFPLLLAIAEGRATAMLGCNGDHAFPIETRDPVTNGVPGMSAYKDSHLAIAPAFGNSQQCTGPQGLGCWHTTAPTQTT